MGEESCSKENPQGHRDGVAACCTWTCTPHLFLSPVHHALPPLSLSRLPPSWPSFPGGGDWASCGALRTSSPGPSPATSIHQCRRMAEPSKVIHIRNVGHEIAESDLLQLLQPFGLVSKIVMLRAKNQALLQMEDIHASVSALQYYSSVQPSVRGRNIYMQFSSHQELTTDQSSHGRNSDQDSEPNRILLVTIHHMIYPITVEVLHQVFKAYGFVEKIVTFQKSAGFQALIQYNSRQEAVEAFGSLHGRNIYDGCCQLDIQYSNLSELQVHYNNDRSRDFTNPSLPTEQRPRTSQQGYPDPAGLYAFQQPGASYAQMGRAAMIAAAFGGTLPHGVTGTNERCTLIVSNLNTDKIDEDKLFNLFSLYGNIVRIKILRNKPDHALVEMVDGLQAELAVHYLKVHSDSPFSSQSHYFLFTSVTFIFYLGMPIFLQGAILFGKKLEVNYSKYPNITPAPDAHDYLNSSLNRFNSNVVKNYRHCCAPTKMIHISALPQEISEEAILNHVSEHGSVINTKLFEVNGKRQALVMFETEEEATEALVSKHASSLEGNTIRISFSQMQSI
ncbi:polypyrimidine tract-binding protein homolog 3-like isoform X2 [Panicum virgatum]|uniref:polypyrimidine tract-binding protein homolog 3-like isoform X2 n=1 Tax=Panicum virgatum TaxID=38727 RepID=UPI0019D5A128|nr:polypyrimidine tract-binding protein homolog 3-like isoform X2 [Panicum virgatum]